MAANLSLDSDLIERALEVSGGRTKKAAMTRARGRLSRGVGENAQSILGASVRKTILSTTRFIAHVRDNRCPRWCIDTGMRRDRDFPLARSLPRSRRLKIE